jgi:hypothetical protein
LSTDWGNVSKGEWIHPALKLIARSFVLGTFWTMDSF